MPNDIQLKTTIRFEAVKEDRGHYYVAFHAPQVGTRFATVNLVFAETSSLEAVAKAMESELNQWSARYTVPVMVTSFDGFDRVINLRPTREGDNLIGWIDLSGRPVLHWQLIGDDNLPGEPFTIESLAKQFKSIPHHISTPEDKQKLMRDQVRQARLIRNVVILWIVVIPVSIALITQCVTWAGWVATGISVLTGFWQLAGLMGWRKKSAGQKAKEEKEARHQHFVYYCERNPEGFDRLKVEVLNREFREEILKEAAGLKKMKE